MPNRSIKFYLELILITVLSLIAASLVSDCVKEYVARTFLGNVCEAKFVIGVGLIGVSAVILWWVFSGNSEKYNSRIDRLESEENI